MDVALASAMLKVLLEEGYVDDSFVQERTTGFDEVKKHVEALDLDDLASETGVSIEEIKEAAIRFGSAASGMIMTARGVEQQTDGYLAVRQFYQYAPCNREDRQTRQRLWRRYRSSQWSRWP